MSGHRARQAIVLLADDDPGDQELTRRALQDDVVKTELRIVSDGEETLEYLFQNGRFNAQTAPRPDLVLLDLNMPRIDGRTVLERMRAHKPLRNIPVVVLTTSNQEQDIVRSYDIGCNSYITKPVDFNQFVRMIRELDHYWLELVVLPKEVEG